MRIFFRRVALLLIGGLATTAILVLLPARHINKPQRVFRKNSGAKGSNPAESGTLPDPKFPIPPADADFEKPIVGRKLYRKSASEEGVTPFPQLPFNDKSENDYSDLPSPKTDLDPSLVGLWKYLTKWEGKDLKRLECPFNESLAVRWVKKYKKKFPLHDSWDRFFAQIGSCDMYRHSESKEVKQLLNDMTTMPIKHAAIMDGGTQVKVLLTFENGKQAVFKPMRYSRQYETDPNHFYFSDFERHHAEIAAFHLDKVLGLRHAVPTVGRIVNLTSEIRDKAEKALHKTFFISPAKNLCFVSKCDYYCDTTHAICGKPDLKEGSLQVFLPDEELVPRDHNRSPYRRYYTIDNRDVHRNPFKRTYSKRKQVATWQRDDSYCEWKVKKKPTFAHGRLLLDLVDMEIFDFFQGNQDRHHFEVFALFGKPAYPLYLDNGRGFGRPREDDLDILAPLRQCCVIRPSMLKRLLEFYTGRVSLSQALHDSLRQDPTAPILAAKQFPALERRLEKVLRVVRRCLEEADSPDDVIMTEYHNPDVDPNAKEEEEEEKKEER